MSLNHKLITDYFPFSEYRKFQKEALEKAEQAFRSGKRFVIIEAPTGSGKSPIAVSAGLWSGSSYILTSQKVLQDQYTRDFADGEQVSVLKGRGNYECNFLGAPATCNECYENVKKQCKIDRSCHYYNAKDRAIDSNVALMNYAYFLSMMECDPSKKFKKRNMLILDEAHSCEKSLMSYIEFSISEFSLKQYGYHVAVPDYDDLQKYVDWMRIHQSNIVELMENKKTEIEQVNMRRARLHKDDHEFITLSIDVKELSSAVEDLDRLNRRISQFLNTLNEVEWVFSSEYNEKIRSRRVTFRPLTVGYFAEESLFQWGDKCLMLSATILDHVSFCKSLGIAQQYVEFIQVPSTFPPEIRKVYCTNTGSMSMTDLDTTLPKITRDIKKTMDFHANEKGIIHCHTYKIASYIKDNLKTNRFIFHDSTNREQKLKEFMESSEPKILVTPSMTEGVDFKGDLARWQIIVKLPYLYLGDKQISRRMKIDPAWYVWQTCLTLVQAYGRIFRSEDDWGTVYIFDSGAPYFIKKNRSILPKWFVDAIVGINK